MQNYVKPNFFRHRPSKAPTFVAICHSIHSIMRLWLNRPNEIARQNANAIWLGNCDGEIHKTPSSWPKILVLTPTWLTSRRISSHWNWSILSHRVLNLEATKNESLKRNKLSNYQLLWMEHDYINRFHQDRPIHFKWSERLCRARKNDEENTKTWLTL